MFCVNPMVVDSWKADPYSGYGDSPGGIEGDEDDDKVADQIPAYPPREPTSSLSRSASCNRINLALPSRKPKRSVSTSGDQRPEVRKRTPESNVCSDNLNREAPKEKEKLKRSHSVLTRLARRASFTRSRRTSSSSRNMSSTQTPCEETTTVITKSRSTRRRRNKNAKNEATNAINQGTIVNPSARLELPKVEQTRVPSSLHMTGGSSQFNGDLISSPDSCPNSPSHFNKAHFSISPPVPEVGPTGSTDPQRATSPNSADGSPLLSPPTDDKSYDSGRMSMLSFRSFGSNGGRPTSFSSVTSSISSRTSRGSDYFSSASSTDQQVASYRLGMQTVLPNVDESDSVDRSVSESDGGEDGSGKIEKGSSKSNEKISRISAFVAHDRRNRNLNDVDHLAPVANLAMVENPDLSYVDRVILELLETERMYVRSLRDILTGYLVVIRSTPKLNIQPHDVDDLFGNIRDVYDFNRNLLCKLEDCYGDPRRVAECFVAKDEDFKVYTEYCTNYPSSVAAMTSCMTNPNLVEFFKEQQDDLRHTLPLGSYLLKPVQRVLKYHLLLQELVKHCDKKEDGYQTIQNALQTMTRVARHINEMKRKHEDAVHIQEIQSLLMNWQGNELTTYGELILESEMKMQGAKNERQVFLFEKMILITKRREDGYLVCKANILCANLVLLESIPNTPLGFQIQPFTEKAASISNTVQPQNGPPPDPNRVQRYILLAPTLEEKSLWTYHIKRLIIETMLATVPLEAKKNIMRMRPVRDGDGDGDSEEDRMRKKSKNRFASSAILGNQENKTTKSALSLFTGGPSTTSSSSLQSMSRKNLHKRALQKRKDEIESSDDISADSGPNTPSGVKAVGKFSFPGFRQSMRSSNAQQANKPSTTQGQSKNATTNSTKNSAKDSENNKPGATPSNQNGDVVKRHHNSVIYRRHKRRSSQPITITEKRLSMKIDDDDNGDKKDDDVVDYDDLMNFNPLTARESVSWDIQIVEAVFERYKKENISPAPPAVKNNSELGSAYLTVPSDVAPSALMSLDHTPILSERRKSRIVVVPSSDSSEEEASAKKKTSASSAVVRRRKSKGGGESHRTSGVVYTLSQEQQVGSDSGLNGTKTFPRKVMHASESARKSLVNHGSDTEADTNNTLQENANTSVRRKTSPKRRELNARRKNDGVANDSSLKRQTTDGTRPESLYDNLDDVTSYSDVIKAPVTCSVQWKSTQTISTVDSSTKTTTELVTVQSTSVTSVSTTSTNDVISTNSNHSNNKLMTSPRGNKTPVVKDMKHIPSGKVRGLIQSMWNSPNSEPIPPTGLIFSSRKTPVTSPTFSTTKERFSFDNKAGNDVVPPFMFCGPSKNLANVNSNDNNNNNNNNDNKAGNDVAPPTIYCGLSKNHANMNSNENNNNNNITSELSNISTDSTRRRFVTTASVPLTITSNSESGEEIGPKKLSTNECVVQGNLKEPKTAQNPSLHLRRTFSHDVNNSNTRTSSNLLLEARVSGEFAEESELRKTTAGGNDSPKDEDFKFGGVEEDVYDAKHYLFEKLCLAPGESYITDKMSEEFEHVCSDLEIDHRLSSLESSRAFSACDEDGFTAAGLDKTLRRELSPLVPKKEIEKIAESAATLKAEKDGNTTAAGKDASKSGKSIVAASSVVPVQSSHEVAKIYGTKATQSFSGFRNYGRQDGRNILPNRSDSIRSTRSEYMTSRLSSAEPDTRGRSQTLRNRNSFKLPSKDMQAIPQMNVSRLAKQFSEISKDSDRLAPPPPRRSRSVEGGTRRRQREQAREEKKKFEPDEAKKNSEPPQREAGLKASSVTNSSPSRTQAPAIKQENDRKKQFEKALVKVDEMFVCETVVDNSRKLQTFAVVSSPEADVTQMEDDVFPGSPKSPVSPEDHESHENRSLVEMFAANPGKNEVEHENASGGEVKTKDEFIEMDCSSTRENAEQKFLIERASPSTPSVRVFLVPRSDNVDGQGSLEPRVMNLSPVRKDTLSHPSLQKRRSWTQFATENDDQPTRTRLRSSSLTKNRRTILTSDASTID